jgi:hypothetical protein
MYAVGDRLMLPFVAMPSSGARICSGRRNALPFRWQGRLRPVRIAVQQLLDDYPHGFGAQLDAFEQPAVRVDRQAVGALDAALLVETQVLELGKNRVEDARLGLMPQQALAKLREYCVVEAAILWQQVQPTLPVEAEAQAIHGLAVGEVFERLEDRHKREQHRRESRLAVVGVQVGEILIAELLEQYVTDKLVDRVFLSKLRVPDCKVRLCLLYRFDEL